MLQRPDQTRQTKALVVTAVWRNGGFSASYDSFVVKQTVVLRIYICGKNPPLRQAAERYRQPYDRAFDIASSNILTVNSST